MRTVARAVLAACGAILIYSFLVEPNVLVLRSVPVHIERFGQSPVRIAQVSDVHMRRRGWRERRVARLIGEALPDLIVITGDLVSTPDAVADACAWVADLRGVAPVYAVPGNYAYLVGGESYLSRLDAAGAVVLRNRAVLLTVRGSSFWLLGVDDPSTTRSRLEDALEDITGSEPRVLLAHFPTIVEQASYYGIQLVLSGHTHGGQVRLPGVGALVRFGSPLLNTYQRGLYRLKGTTMFVSSGVGTVGLPVRFLCPPEVALLLLREG